MATYFSKCLLQEGVLNLIFSRDGDYICFRIEFISYNPRFEFIEQVYFNVAISTRQNYFIIIEA